jgi:hypothetical protein
LGQFYSENWSGYVVANFETALHYNGAQGTWKVPTVNAGADPGYSATWVGIGGFCENSICSKVDSTIIQLGTEENYSSSGTSYYAWYATAPGFENQIPLAINAGDKITVTLSASGVKKQSWTLTMTDNTTGGNWSKTLRYSSSELSAEWIEEAPSSFGGILPLANYGTVTFDPGSADGGIPNFTQSESVIMEDPSGQTSNPSAPDTDSGGSDGFNACWGSGSLTTCSQPNS